MPRKIDAEVFPSPRPHATLRGHRGQSAEAKLTTHPIQYHGVAWITATDRANAPGRRPPRNAALEMENGNA